MKRLPSAVEKQVKLIELKAQHFMNDWMSGTYKSRFRGMGLQFSDHQQYTPGDDIRHIDWKVSARTREPMVKRFEEERERTVFIIIDVSTSQLFGSTQSQKKQVAAEVGGLLALAASKAGDKVGALLLSSGNTKLIRPAKGRNHVRRIVHEILNSGNHPGRINLTHAVEQLARVLVHRSIVIVLSDFLGMDGLDRLMELGKSNDLIGLSTTDVTEGEVPIRGWIPLMDAENASEFDADTGTYRVQTHLKEAAEESRRLAKEAFMRARGEFATLMTHEDYIHALARFLNRR
jgi:uncharacterized protein (DUF58 family)